jgi:hypothetical protein
LSKIRTNFVGLNFFCCGQAKPNQFCLFPSHNITLMRN